MLRYFRLHELIIFIFTTCSLILVSNPVLASFYKQNCEEQGLGWHFYCDRQKAEIDKEDNKQISSQSQAETANQTVENLKKQHDTLLNTAIIFPTEENIKKYLAFNLENLNRSSFFAESAQRAIWQTPDLNYNLKRPVNSVGKRTWIDEQNKKKKDTVLNLNSRYGVFFFYSSDCPYCHAYSPILKSFADTYDIQIKAVTLNGGILKEWPDSVIDQGQAAKLGVDRFPSTVLFDNQTKETTVIHGALSQEELLQQIYVLTQTKPGEEL